VFQAKYAVCEVRSELAKLNLLCFEMLRKAGCDPFLFALRSTTVHGKSFEGGNFCRFRG